MNRVSVIMFFERHPHRTILTGLTIEEAKKICKDRETSSSTATSELAKYITKTYGPRFLGYEGK